MKKAALAVLVGLVLLLGAGCQKRGPGVAGGGIKGLERVHFDFDRSDIRDDSKKVLNKNKKFLESNPDLDVVIEGHCDERGTEEYNIALGHRRSQAAKDYLVSMGIGGKRLRTKSYGEERPLEKCHNESCWWKNRRADFAKK